MRPPGIVIESVAAATPWGDVEGIWRAWLDPPRRPPSDAKKFCDPESVLRLVLAGTDVASTGLVLATTKGDIDSQVAWMRKADGLDEPLAPALPPTLGSAAGRMARAAALPGPVYAVSTACSSGITALIDAALLLLDGEAERMIALGMDDAGDFVRDGFTALHALSPTNTCRPFDKDRDGLTLGSACAAALLTLADSPVRPFADSILLTGWGVASDAVHLTAPDRQASGLIRAVSSALDMAGLRPRDIDVFFAHGTGTRYNDAMETVAIDALFRRDGGRGPAITAVKGLIGHALGAAGLIETVLAVKMLQTQLVPPVTGLVNPERPDLDLVTAPRPMNVRHILKVASGFGGLNAAVILSRPEASA